MPAKPLVVIDARMVGEHPHGFARYVTRLAEGLKPMGYEAGFLVTPELHRQRTRVFSRFKTIPVRASFLSPAELFEIPRALGQAGAALYHSPTFSSLISCPCPWVITIHDLNHLHFGGVREKIYYRLLLRRFASKARRVITVSEFSRAELAPWLDLEEGRIELAMNALDPELLAPLADQEIDSELRALGLSRGRYFFCLSGAKTHKNTDLLLRAHDEYRQKNPSRAWPLITNLPSGLGPIRDRLAKVLMSGAGAFVFPSLYEGFGLPPVEAAALGTPVVASRIPPIREGLCDLSSSEVLWVDPKSREAWVAALEQAANGALSRVSAGARESIVARFSPEKLGADMDRIYRHVLDQQL